VGDYQEPPYADYSHGCIEELQTRLGGQQDNNNITSPVAESPPQRTLGSGDKDGKGRMANSQRESIPVSTDVRSDFGGIQGWSAPVSPEEDIEQWSQSLGLALFESQQVPAQVPAQVLASVVPSLGLEVQLTSMICTDL
jgi:hypothetical protein